MCEEPLPLWNVEANKFSVFRVQIVLNFGSLSIKVVVVVVVDLFFGLLKEILISLHM